MGSKRITSLHIKNFKAIKDQKFEFTNFDLLVGNNNCGKSTILQAMAIWQYCIDEFHRSNRKGNRGIQIVLPNFTALPLPEFNLLWNDKTDRQYPEKNGEKIQEFILIEITVFWKNEKGDEEKFGVSLRYQSSQSVFAKPNEGWQVFKELDEQSKLPRIVYVPPFSGLEPNEIWYDNGIIRKNVGKAQPGSVLRNLLFRVTDKQEENDRGGYTDIELKNNKEWIELQSLIKQWFGVKLNPPLYEKGVSTEIKVSYSTDFRKEFDIISGGSGFHQILTLLAFYYGYPEVSTILFDEPDAHLHVNLQRKILNHFKALPQIQFIIATHAEEFVKGVNVQSILSIFSQSPKRIQSIPPIITALSEIENNCIVQVTQSPYILYVEGEDDERILNSWARILDKEEVLSRFYIHKMGGTTKTDMKERAEAHFLGLRQIVPDVERVMLFDYDNESTAFKPDKDNPVLFEWKRKNIENYLLVPDSWKRTILFLENILEPNLFTNPFFEQVDVFFNEQNLTLPPKSTWQNVKANVFEVVDGKKLLFENEDSLFQILRELSGHIINRETVAMNMEIDEIHSDIIEFFEKLESKIPVVWIPVKK
ncbi:MAG: AAA family ATPase [Bacteroidales bacterium]|nr:AAA family ATPase [Bacteroidales bacterium]MCF8457186.1 AAA family ATPase [Bacteroidales bacterium]